MAQPSTPPFASSPIPPPFQNLPFGKVQAGGDVYLSTVAIQFLQELWAAIQGQDGLLSQGAIQALLVGAASSGALSGRYAMRNLRNAKYQNPGVGAVPEPVIEKWARYVEVEDFGAKGDAVFNAGTSTWTGTDDTRAFLDARDWSLANGYPPVIFAGAAYLISGEISAEGGVITAPVYTQLGASFFTPSGATIAFAPPAAGTPCFSFYGGAGKATNKYLKGFPNIVPASPVFVGMGIGVYADSVGAGLIVDANVANLATGHQLCNIVAGGFMESSTWRGFLTTNTVNCHFLVNGGNISMRDTHTHHLMAIGTGTDGYLFEGASAVCYVYLSDINAQIDAAPGVGNAIRLVNANVDSVTGSIKVENAAIITSDNLSQWNGGYYTAVGAATTVSGTLGVFQFDRFTNNHAVGTAYGTFTDPLLAGVSPAHAGNLYAGRESGTVTPFSIPGIGAGILHKIDAVYLGSARFLGTVAANDPTSYAVGVIEYGDGGGVAYKAASTDISNNGQTGMIQLANNRTGGKFGRDTTVHITATGTYTLADNSAGASFYELSWCKIFVSGIDGGALNFIWACTLMWALDGFGNAGYVVNFAKLNDNNASAGAVTTPVVGDFSVTPAGQLQLHIVTTEHLRIDYTDIGVFRTRTS